MKVITVNNQKGGVGKTTLACHLVLAGAEGTGRVLLIDLDTQGSASMTILHDPAVRHRPGGAEALFRGDELEPLSSPHGVDVLHGHRELDVVDSIPLAEAVALRERVRSLPYDLVVIDTPPAGVEARHLAPMFWADVVVIPLEANHYSLAAIEDTLMTIEHVHAHNPELTPRLIINRYRIQDSAQRNYAAAMMRAAQFLEPHLGLHAAVAAALDEGSPVWAYRGAAPEVRSEWQQVCGGLIS